MVENIGQGGRVHFAQGVENLWGSDYRQSIGRIDSLFEQNNGLELQIGDYSLRAEEGEIRIYDKNGKLADQDIRQVLVDTFGEDQTPYFLYQVLGRLRQHNLSGKKIDLGALVTAARKIGGPASQAARQVVTPENLIARESAPPAPDPHPLQTFVENVNTNPVRYLDPIGFALSEGATPGRLDDQEVAELSQNVPEEVVEALRDGKINETERDRLGLDPGLYQAYIAGRRNPVEQLNGLLTTLAIQGALPAFIGTLTAEQIALIDADGPEDPDHYVWFNVGGWPVLPSEIQLWRSQSPELEVLYAARKKLLNSPEPPALAQND